jgi:MFS transporter, PAT family, solute carrier family 33 (acetyl-CoA transportor), member 1
MPNPVGGGSSVENESNSRSNNHDTDRRDEAPEQDDRYNYALLIVLYTLQGIPMGLSASIPFLIQQKVRMITAMAASAAEGSSATGAAAAHAAKLSYHANAIFALCSWPFSLKMLWAPIVDSMYFKRFGRRKSWLVPVQALSGLVMVFGAGFVEQQLGLGSLSAATERTSRDLRPHRRILAAATETLASQGEGALINVRGITTFFFLLYFLMATQDIAVDGWALSMLSKKNRGRGPVCNSIGQNIGYFLSFVGFLAFNDVETSETIWRPLLGLRSMPGTGLVSLGGFVQFMGYFMLTTTIVVALIKTEAPPEQDVAYASSIPKSKEALLSSDRFGKANEDDDAELDASQIGLKETYHRLWAVCQLSSVRRLFLILMTYRLPTALSDNVKFLKAVEYGLSKSTTALLSPTVILPLGILVPIVATKVWHGQPLDQFMIGYLVRVMIVPILDLAMLAVVKRGKSHTSLERMSFWLAVVSSTAGQAITSSLQFNAQMTCKSSIEV